MGAHRYADHPSLEHMDFVGDEGVRYWDTFCGEGPHIRGLMLHYVLSENPPRGAEEWRVVATAARRAQELGYITNVEGHDLYAMKRRG